MCNYYEFVTVFITILQLKLLCLATHKGVCIQPANPMPSVQTVIHF